MTQRVNDLERAIRRTTMNRGQITLLKYLYEADDYVSRDRIVDDIRWGDSQSFTGVLSAFSNRINNTEGMAENPGYEAFIERRDIDGQEHLRLRQTARNAIENVPELLEVFEQPMDELLDGIKVEFDDISLADSVTGEEDQQTDKWEPTTTENHLLVGYWNDVGGIIITEVEVGSSGPSDWASGSKPRQLDGLRFRSEYRDEINSQTRFTQEQLQDIIDGQHVEVIEVKKNLNRPVIGQAIAGRDLLARDYNPATIEPVVVCQNNDPALEWVCRKNGIRVAIVNQ